ncbi:MAG: V-type ATP synthase subunit E [Chloroflexota bacterium]|jgi:V/A-type H+-transporting ATPase subunit E
MDNAEGIEALRQAILNEASDTARYEIEQANRSVERRRQEAEQEAEASSREILREARRQSELITRQVASATEVEVKRRQIEMRERLLREIFEDALTALREEQGPARAQTLLRLAIEAAREIGGGSLLIQVSPEDVKLVTPEFVQAVEDRLAEEGIHAELVLAEQSVNITGGVIVSREKGKIVVDNSFEARMVRQEPILRSGVWHLLQGEGTGSG